MILRPLFLSTLVLAAALGCGGSRPVPPTVHLQSGARIAPIDHHADEGEVLIWVRNDAGKTKTFRLAAEEPLRVLGEQEGIAIASARGELIWQQQEVEVNLDGCEHFDGSPAIPTKGMITHVNLVKPDGKIEQKVVESPERDGGEIDDLQHNVTLLGSIGPYIFVHESSYMYACGAHGLTTAGAFVWDIESGKAIDLLGEVPAKEQLSEQARAMLDEGEPDPTGQPSDETEKPEPTQIAPMYGDKGALNLEVQFTRWACYMCGDGQWGSYTRSASVPAGWTPPRMKAWASPPVVVKEFLETHRDWQLGGWSKREGASTSDVPGIDAH